MKSPLTAHARTLRQQMTPHEVRLWACLRAWRTDGLEFRRQVTLGPYIVDFACFRPKIVVELDGGQHTSEAHAAKVPSAMRGTAGKVSPSSAPGTMKSTTISTPSWMACGTWSNRGEKVLPLDGEGVRHSRTEGVERAAFPVSQSHPLHRC
jgi:hypothetical protein